MPVGGSVSASSLNKAAGARTRYSLVIAGVVMALIIVALGDLLDQVAMPALAGLLIVVGIRTITPADLGSVWRTGAVQKVVLTTTFVLTVMIPIQYAVLIGVGLSAVLYVVRQSNQGHDPTSRVHSRWARRRNRPAHRRPPERGGHPATVRQHVLRGCSNVRSVLTERRAGIARTPWSSCVCGNERISALRSSTFFADMRRGSPPSVQSWSSSPSATGLPINFA